MREGSQPYALPQHVLLRRVRRTHKALGISYAFGDSLTDCCNAAYTHYNQQQVANWPTRCRF